MGHDNVLIWRLHAQVKRFGDRVALRKKDFGIWQEISWNQYAEHIKCFCLGLLFLGLKKNDSVCILSESRPEWLFADFGIQTAGAVTVGIYGTDASSQVAYIHKNSEAKLCICEDQEQVDKILEVKKDLPNLAKIIVIDMKGLRNYSDRDLLSFSDVEDMGREHEKENPGLYEKLVKNINADDIAVHIYTSGTTGLPKAAMLTHKNMVAAVDALCEVVGFSESDNLVAYLPLCHVGERITSVYIPVTVGSTVNFAESIETVNAALYQISPNVFLGVPRIWEKMQASVIIKMQESTIFRKFMFNLFMGIGKKVSTLKLAKKKVPWHLKLLFRLGHLLVYRKILDQLGLLRVRVAISGAAAIGPDVLKFFHQLGLNILEFYGGTELSGATFINPPNDIRIGTVGKVMPRMEVKLADDGEIMERGPQVFAGYFKDEKGTRESFDSGWFLSGDVGEFDEDGYLRILDRKKDILVTPGGKNIAPQLIENKLKFSPYINEAIVVGGEGYRYIAALIQIEMENIGKWAQTKNIPYTTFWDLSSKPEVYDLIANEVKKANSELARVEQVKRFLLLSKELDHDEGELTATLKVRRKAIYARYKETIKQVYAEGYNI